MKLKDLIKEDVMKMTPMDKSYPMSSYEGHFNLKGYSANMEHDNNIGVFPTFHIGASGRHGSQVYFVAPDEKSLNKFESEFAKLVKKLDKDIMALAKKHKVEKK
jgi:hypothetical protein